MYEATFKIKYDNNQLYCNNYLYKYNDSGYNIFHVNVHSIIKKYFLNYLIMPKYQTLLINQVLVDQTNRRNSKVISLFNLA